MKTSSKLNRVDLKYIIVAGLAVALSWFIHEFAHWLTGKFLGYDMAMTLNSAYPATGQYKSDSDYQIISAAGPLITLLEAIIVFSIMQRRKVALLYPFLFTCFYMRFFAAGISFLNPNDEARISKSLGIGMFTLPIIITAILFYLVYKISKQYAFSGRFNMITFVLVIFFTSVIVLSDQFLHIQLLFIDALRIF